MTETRSITLTIVNRKGLHARAAARFVKTASPFDAGITVGRDGREVDGRSIMGLLTLAASQGRDIIVKASGRQKDEILSALSELVVMGFYEEDNE